LTGRYATSWRICSHSSAPDVAAFYRMAQNGATRAAISASAMKRAVMTCHSQQKVMRRVLFTDVPTAAAIFTACARCDARLLAWLAAARTTLENSMRVFDCSAVAAVYDRRSNQ
jgi:hypothetical protein